MDEEQTPGGLSSGWKHPQTVFFHMLFRTGAFLTYIFCTTFSSSFTINFIAVVLLLSFDFWTVKNVTGRLLVGLRWWNQIDDQGQSKWRYESNQHFKPQASEARLFWWSLYLFTAGWVLLALFALIRLKISYLLVCAIAISLNTSNVIGYTRCHKDAANKIKSMAGSYLGQQLGQTLINQAFAS
eukprot:TRINITY_DN7402_c0_g1_i2.p1 TRINITY_DN7402_c0_g1~~TRINITY_DN7402_c0_g1_i2.p1  ORF type:complete len:184 (+),score=15.29 TRINITY_DN7402_c0_g1_i2:110-661(+)